MKHQNETKERRPLWQDVLVGLIVLLTVFGATCGPFVFLMLAIVFDDPISLLRSLPSDEKMIEHFCRHRADFERLVHIYRENLSVPIKATLLMPTPEIRSLMDRINVIEVYGDAELWLPPDPYSKEAEFISKESKLIPWRTNGRKFNGVMFNYGHKRVKSLKYMAYLDKHYYYVPLVPKIEDGQLKIPFRGSSVGGRMLQSLDKFPRKFRSSDRLFRQIEPNWFIMMEQRGIPFDS
jgi:hypothetical protein